jgi:Ran GTPase-activating protein (RanGAP) involved in mRNA processing and transport
MSKSQEGLPKEEYSSTELFFMGFDGILENARKNDPKLSNIHSIDITQSTRRHMPEEKSDPIVLDKFNNLTKALKENTHVKTINFHDNRFSGKALEYLAKFIEENQALEQLIFRDCEIGDDGLSLVLKALEKNHTLQGIDLISNKITAKGAKELADFFKRNTTIKSLRLNNNCIGDEGLGYLIESGVINRLKEFQIDITRNEITKKGFNALISCLISENNLEILGIKRSKYGDEIGDQELEQLIPLIENSKIKNIDLSSNNIILEKTELAQKLTSALGTAPTEILNLSFNNEMQSGGWEKLRDAVNIFGKKILISYEANEKVADFEWELKESGQQRIDAPKEADEQKIVDSGSIEKADEQKIVDPDSIETTNQTIVDSDSIEKTDEQKIVNSNNNESRPRTTLLQRVLRCFNLTGLNQQNGTTEARPR